MIDVCAVIDTLPSIFLFVIFLNLEIIFFSFWGTANLNHRKTIYFVQTHPMNFILRFTTQIILDTAFYQILFLNSPLLH